MKETDLYLPVKNLFENLAYKVVAEVGNIDVIAIKEDDLVIIELKTSFSLKLILQGIDRQKISDNVYVGILKPKNFRPNSKSLKEKTNLLKRLNLGLIIVTINKRESYAQILLDPKPDYKLNKINNKRRNSVLKEISQRSLNTNVGGTRGKLVTAYKEKAIDILYVLKSNDQLTVKEIRQLTGHEKTQSILYKNYYGWFERVSHGVYSISEKGISAYYEFSKK